MMHDCPKCGFHQPKDRYCASCGVDIDKYSARPKPILLSILSSTKTQIAIVTMTVIGLVVFIYISQKSIIDATLSGAFNSETTESEPTTFESAKFEATPVVAQAQPSPQTATIKPQARTVEPATDKKERRKKLIFEFAEVPKPLLQDLINEGQVLNETQNTKSFYFAHTGEIKNIKRKDLRPDFLPGATESNILPDSPIRLDFTRFAKGFTSELGLNIEIDVLANSPEQIELTLLAIINLAGDGDNVVTTEYQGRYNFDANGVLAISGLVPVQSIRGEVESALSTTPLAIMTSPDFVARATEFVIFIQAE